MHNVFFGGKGDQAKRAIDRVNLQLAKFLGMQLHILYHAGWVLKNNGNRRQFVPASTLITDDRNDHFSKSFRSLPKFMRVISVVTK